MKPISQVLSQLQLTRLDAEVLLAHALQVDRSFLYSHPNDLIDEAIVLPLYQRRLYGEPIAYIIGKKDFWRSTFVVNEHVLIPRPETELLVENALSFFSKEQKIKVADLGTGSGAIALSLAQERPQWEIVATDISEQALLVARQNQKNLQLDTVQFYLGSWCDALPHEKFDMIVANPPYIAEGDVHLSQGDLRFEPLSALMAAEQGLAAIRLIAQQARQYLKMSGLLLVEHGYDQADAVRDIFEKTGYRDIQCLKDLAGLNRMTVAREKSACSAVGSGVIEK